MILGHSMVKILNGQDISQKAGGCKFNLRSFSVVKEEQMNDNIRSALRKDLHIGISFSR